MIQQGHCRRPRSSVNLLSVSFEANSHQGWGLLEYRRTATARASSRRDGSKARAIDIKAEKPSRMRAARASDRTEPCQTKVVNL